MSKKGRNIDGLDEEVNPTVYNRLMRQRLSCSYCRPNQVENSNRIEKKSWKAKSRRKRQFMEEPHGLE